MNEIVIRMIESQAQMFLYMLCGFILARIHIIRQDNRQVLVKLLMNLAMPMMVLSAFNKQTTLEELKSSLLVMLIALLGCVLTGLIGLLLWRKQPDHRKKVLMYASMFSNAGNAGLPVLNLVFGETGVFFGSMYLIPPRILQWTVGIGLFVKPERKSFVKNVLLNPMVITIYIGAFLMATSWVIPGVFGTTITSLGNMAAPLSMILIGATIAGVDWRTLLMPSALLISALRLIVFPALCALLLKVAGVDSLGMNLCVILLAMPVASNTAAMAEMYGGDEVFAAACVSVSTLLSVVTVPLMTWFVQML